MDNSEHKEQPPEVQKKKRGLLNSSRVVFTALALGSMLGVARERTSRTEVQKKSPIQKLTTKVRDILNGVNTLHQYPDVNPNTDLNEPGHFASDLDNVDSAANVLNFLDQNVDELIPQAYAFYTEHPQLFDKEHALQRHKQLSDLQNRLNTVTRFLGNQDYLKQTLPDGKVDPFRSIFPTHDLGLVELHQVVNNILHFPLTDKTIFDQYVEQTKENGVSSDQWIAAYEEYKNNADLVITDFEREMHRMVETYTGYLTPTEQQKLSADIDDISAKLRKLLIAVVPAKVPGDYRPEQVEVAYLDSVAALKNFFEATTRLVTEQVLLDLIDDLSKVQNVEELPSQQRENFYVFLLGVSASLYLVRHGKEDFERMRPLRRKK